MNKIDKHYVSEIDKKLAEFDASHPRSASQQAEFAKYQDIYQKRDVPSDENVDERDLWG